MEYQHWRKRLDENLLLSVDGLLLGLCGVDRFLLSVRLRLRLRLCRQRNLHRLWMRDVRQGILNSVNLVMLKEKKAKGSIISSLLLLTSHNKNNKIIYT